MDLVEEANDTINDIGIDLVRQIFTLRYIKWLRMETSSGKYRGNNTADSVRKNS